MGQIKVSPETLQTRAREYSKASKEAMESLGVSKFIIYKNGILSNLSALQQTLAAEWEGQAFQGFDRQFNELKPKVKEFAELLEQINVQLVGAARAMEEHDQALSQKFGLN